MMHDWWGWSGSGFGPMWLGPVFMILVPALLIVAIIVAIRWIGAAGGPDARPPTAREILDQRYARGEIDQVEYEKRRRTIES